MKRFTLFLSLLVAMVITTMAQTVVTTINTAKYYTLECCSGAAHSTTRFISDDGEVINGQSSSSTFFVFEDGETEGTYYIKSYTSGRYINCDADFKLSASETKSTAWVLGTVGQTVTFKYPDATRYLNNVNTSCDDGTITYLQANNHPSGPTSSNACSTWELKEYESVDPLFTPKSEAKATVEALAKINVIFPDATDVLAAIEASESEDAINTIVANYTQNAADKNIKLCNKGGNGRAGNYLGYDKTNSRAAAVANSDEVIWTIKMNADGTFKLYNYLNNLYLGAPADPTPTTANEEDAPSFTIIPTAENVAAVVCTNGNMVHVANHSNYKIISYYSLTDAASLWDVTVVPEIVVERDVYYNGVAAATTLPYAIQQAYGLVTDASNYYSNYKSDAEGSYEALLDNDVTSYFHSAYNSEPGDGSGVHYIQANLGAGNSVDEFYFYMVPRSGNSNNRPVDITVSGSNDNETYTEITTVKTTLDGSMTPYLSAKLGTDGTNYQYIRLTVTSTNTGTIFFTLSELYFFPATSDVTDLVDSYNTFKASSITDVAMNDAATTLVNAESVLALSNVKKEIAALISTNENNHAATPALGQYTTAGYNALVAAYNADDATQESLEAAIVAFNASKNSPIFTINGIVDYAAGKSIYEDLGNTNAKGNDLYFKTTNQYDKTMWWVLDQTTTTINVIDNVGIRNYATGNGFWGASSINITETSDANTEDNQFLFYTVGNGTPIHAQNDNQLITRWDTKESNSGSAWSFTYIGNTYELDQLTDEKIAALVALQEAYNAKAFYADAVIGDGLGEYTGDREAIVAALPAAETIGAKTLAEQATLSMDEITSATTALNDAEALVINLPEEGKYYRIKGACDATPANYYITGNTNADGGRIACKADADASTIFFYNDGKLLAYNSGLYIGVNSSNYKFSSVDGTTPATEITFAGSPRKAGTYTVNSDDRFLYYKVYYGEVEIDRYQDNNSVYLDWTLEEVTELPVTVTAAGYATLYAPVALTVPTGVTAHTVTLNGEWATLSEALTTIPANTGVVLAGEGSHSFAITTADAFNGTNALTGSVAAEYKTEDAYVLGVVDEKVGFYIATKNQAENTAFQNNSHKAYLPKTTGMNAVSYSFRFGEGTTGIDEITENREQSTVIYDLTGRRVEEITEPGIYIVNGVKKLVR